jgi:hypothetical protein
MHVTRAWRSTQGAGVTVALLDTGVDAKQADLDGSVITGPDYTHLGRTPGGAFWGVHGTEIASIIAGHGHGAGNNAGVMGVAPQAKILSVRVTLESNDPLLTNATVAAGLPNAIARGIRYAVKHHAAVIDLPLDPVTASGAAGSGSRAERAAVAYANARHVVLVAPAGDGGAGGAVNYPAAYPGVISVGAFNEKFVKAPYSSRRPYVTLTAPGDGVTAASGLKSYALVHSTSAASAVVAGIAALIKAQFPKLSSARVRQVLTTSTVYRPKGGRADGSGYGTVDAAAALMAASKLVEAVPAAATGASAGAQTPPTAPAVHSTVIRKNLGHSLITDVAIAVALFLVLLGAILGFASWRRRRARSARLAAVRAATQVPARRTGKPAAKGNPFGNGMPLAGESGPVITGKALGNGGNAMGNAAWPPASNPMAGPGLSGAGFTGSGTPGSGLTGARTRTPGAWMSGGGTSGGGDSHAAGIPDRATSQPQIEPVGFVPAPLVPGSEPPGFGTSGPGSPDHAPGASGASEDPAADSPAQLNTPPWAPIQTDPSARFRSGNSAAIPTSAFPGPAASAGAEPPGDAGGAGGADRAPGRRAQGTPRGPVRTPPVSGSPPWGPAPQPDSELPWTQAPTPPRSDAGLLARQPARPEMPMWDAMAEEAWPGGPRAAKPHPPTASPADSTSGLASRHPGGPAGSPPRPADPRPADPRPADPQPDGRQQAGQPIYPWNAGTTAEAPGVTSPNPGLGFLRGARPTGTTRPPSARPGPARSGTGPASATPASAGAAGPAPQGTGPAGFGPAGAASPGATSPGTGPSGAGPSDAKPSDAKPKIGVPPWEITDSFLAIRTDRPGPARDDGSFPAAPAVRDENAGFPRDGGSLPSRPAEPPRVSGGSDLFSKSTGTPSFPSSGASFPASTAEPGGFPGGEASFPSATSGFPRASSFPRTPDQTPDSPRAGSFPGAPGETPSFPRSGGSFPGGPAQPPGLPGAGLPKRGAADAPGENTENIPAVAPPSGEGKLPRRIPLSERTSGFPPVPRRSDDDAFRLFPFGKNAETPTATPPSDNTED